MRRPDDHPDSVKARLDKYLEVTRPVYEYYESKRLLKRFPGTESNVIFKDVDASLRKNYSF
jgi:adenylate kinase family enzyme